MLKSFATIVELDITIADFVFDSIPQAGIWISPINEKTLVQIIHTLLQFME